MGPLCGRDAGFASGRSEPRPPTTSFGLEDQAIVFASGPFLYFFLPVFLVLYYASPRSLRSYTLAFASYLFYGWWRPDFVLLMLGSTVVDYGCGLGIARARRNGGRGKRFVLLSLTVNLGLLAYFKYANFGVDTLNAILVASNVEPFPWAPVILPVGISFYTFQTISYTVDIYRGDCERARSFRDMMAYVSMFPQLIAGPIVRYNSVAEQLHSRTHSWAKFYRGILFFQCGMAKKVLLADTIAPLADQAFSLSGLATLDAWLGAIAYAFQIYFDFSGYSDMAIGLGLMIGFRFPINFNSPYRSESITDFWRRWHISLSTFLRDYLYVPLGGNRLGKARTYVNLATTMLLGGLWHGAAWTYIAWGAYQGLWLIVERLLGKRSLYGRAPRPVRIGITFVIALFGWVFFRATSLPEASRYCLSMIGVVTADEPALLDLKPLYALSGVIGAFVVWFLPTSQVLVHRGRAWFVLFLQAAFLLALLHLHYENHVPFLYFQF